MRTSEADVQDDDDDGLRRQVGLLEVCRGRSEELSSLTFALPSNKCNTPSRRVGGRNGNSDGGGKPNKCQLAIRRI